jgi:hypothetical protein
MNNMDKTATEDVVSGSVGTAAGAGETMRVIGRYHFEFRDPAGNLQWEKDLDNLVVTTGRDSMLDEFLAGSSYTAAFYCSLVDGASTPTFAAGDTMASHAGWTENTSYTEATRPAPSWSASSGGTKSFSAAVTFTYTGAATIAGAFLTTNSTKGGTTGTLYSAGAFTGGSQSITSSGGTLSVSYSTTLT